MDESFENVILDIWVGFLLEYMVMVVGLFLVIFFMCMLCVFLGYLGVNVFFFLIGVFIVE